MTYGIIFFAIIRFNTENCKYIQLIATKFMENFKNKMPQMSYRLNSKRILFVGTETIHVYQIQSAIVNGKL